MTPRQRLELFVGRHWPWGLVMLCGFIEGYALGFGVADIIWVSSFICVGVLVGVLSRPMQRRERVPDLDATVGALLQALGIFLAAAFIGYCLSSVSFSWLFVFV
jgi:uncharacterized membrane protein